MQYIAYISNTRCLCNSRERERERERERAVSYTHLDVYKRQALGCLEYPLKMAASGAAETFGFDENLGPRPNSPADSLV